MGGDGRRQGTGPGPGRATGAGTGTAATRGRGEGSGAGAQPQGLGHRKSLLLRIRADHWQAPQRSLALPVAFINKTSLTNPPGLGACPARVCGLPEVKGPEAPIL